MLLPVELKDEKGAVVTSLKLSTRAMMALEADFSKPISDVLDVLDANPKVSDIVKVVSRMMNDGFGVEETEAMDIIDQVGGVVRVMPPYVEAVKRAFPAAPEGGTEGNAKRPPKKK